ncbi:MAG: hypothetical protein WD740_05255 [Anaerolineales bacterium]
MKREFAFIIVITLVLILQACAGVPAAAVDPIDEGDQAGVPDTGGGLAIAGANTLDLSNPDNFSEMPGNYQITMDFRFEAVQADGTPLTSSWRLDGVNQVEPPANRYTFTGTGAASIQGSGLFEITTIGEQTYFFTSQMGCINMSVDTADTPFDTMVDTGGMLANQATRVLPDEIINGVPVYHYAITQDNLDLDDPTSMDISQITNGAIYVAKDGGYVVRMLLEGRGVSSLLAGDETLEGDILYQLDFTPVPSVGEITLPEGCVGATESDFPMLPDASNTASFAGFLSYSTASELTAASDFYKSEMAAAGWTLTDESLIANFVTLRFSMGARTVSVVVSFDANSSLSNVVIGEE